jgi:hypothetical protein
MNKEKDKGIEEKSAITYKKKREECNRFYSFLELRVNHMALDKKEIKSASYML